jgi:hypothetical protein
MSASQSEADIIAFLDNVGYVPLGDIAASNYMGVFTISGG